MLETVFENIGRIDRGAVVREILFGDECVALTNAHHAVGVEHFFGVQTLRQCVGIAQHQGHAERFGELTTTHYRSFETPHSVVTRIQEFEAGKVGLGAVVSHDDVHAIVELLPEANKVKIAIELTDLETLFHPGLQIPACLRL